MRYAGSVVDRFNPLYFLSSVGAGGLAVSFFMYLMWMTPHPDQPIPSFTTLSAAFQSGSPWMQALIIGASLGIAFFSFMHLRLLAWNLGQFSQWKKTAAYEKLRTGNAENQLMAMPLTFAMTVNVMFIVGAVFVPGLWEIAEYLFPAAIAAFALIGVWALSIFGDFMGRVLTKGGFDCTKNNSLSQVLSVFAFGMIGVGFSASAAMSHVKAVSVIAFMGSAFFIFMALIFAVMFLVMGFRSMMENVAEKETSPTLWIIIPFVTVVGIAFFRLFKALEHNFGVEWAAGSQFAFLAFLFSIQLVFGFLGYTVMRRFGYFQHFVSGEARSAGSYALICPGVALFVFGSFLIHPGLIGIGVLSKFSVAYFLLYAPLVAIQIVTIRTFFRLNAKMLREDGARPVKLAPAE